MAKAIVPSWLLIIEIGIIYSQYQAQYNTINIIYVNQISNLKKLKACNFSFQLC